MPDLLHVIPVSDDAVLDGVLEGEDTSLGLGLIAHIAVFLAHTNHHTLGEGEERGEGWLILIVGFIFSFHERKRMIE